MKPLVLDEVWFELGYLLRPAIAVACVRRVSAKGDCDGCWLSNSAAGQLLPTRLLCSSKVLQTIERRHHFAGSRTKPSAGRQTHNLFTSGRSHEKFGQVLLSSQCPTLIT